MTPTFRRIRGELPGAKRQGLAFGGSDLRGVWGNGSPRRVCCYEMRGYLHGGLAGITPMGLALCRQSRKVHLASELISFCGSLEALVVNEILRKIKLFIKIPENTDFRGRRGENHGRGGSSQGREHL